MKEKEYYTSKEIAKIFANYLEIYEDCELYKESFDINIHQINGRGRCTKEERIDNAEKTINQYKLLLMKCKKILPREINDKLPKNKNIETKIMENIKEVESFKNELFIQKK